MKYLYYTKRRSKIVSMSLFKITSVYNVAVQYTTRADTLDAFRVTSAYNVAVQYTTRADTLDAFRVATRV